ncbi:ABC transporter permease subunit/CPBP intramembrane protease [Rubinisphaera italica]|uniref:ABC-2 family transporter protein n=1 Tax=Rubinisphaera italica TaxID=2527969 RepID=A0A5C5XMN5_9PLAN|nr:ABC transporter permease subunit/CPBP intramembrane protease [Rubinisphaera italica]TWT63002.1 ABC-2 family transporter protein [Rubinisphaera italica]
MNSDSPSDKTTARQQMVAFIRKELRETLRDRRTIITLLAMPILLYPLLGMCFRFMAVNANQTASAPLRLTLNSETEALWLQQALKTGGTILEQFQDSTEAPDLEFEYLIPQDNDGEHSLENSISNTQADLGIKIQPLGEEGANPYSKVSIQLIQRSGSPASETAASYVASRLNALNIARIEHWSLENNSTLDIPIRQSKSFVAPVETPNAILQLFPLVLLMMTVTGGVYPAIDLTAGERERDTMETLMALPVPKFRILIAKYVAVITVTLLTGLMNLTAMTITAYVLQIEGTLFGAEGLTFLLLLKLFAVLAAFAVFFSAALLMVTSSARSFKEAQAYLIPLLLVAIAPGFVIMLPGAELNQMTAFVPMVNMLLLARDLFDGQARWLPSVIAFLTTLLYSFSLLAAAARMFGTDAVSTGSRGQWAELFIRPDHIVDKPTFGNSTFILAMLFPFYFVCSGLLQRVSEVSMSQRLLASAGLTALLFVVLPIAFACWQRLKLKSTFRINRPNGLVWPGVILLGLSTWPWIFEVVVLLEAMGLQTLDASKIENVKSLLETWQQIPLWVIIVALGVIPGLCEEFFFRGFLFSGWRSSAGRVATICGTALAFGLFHVVLAGGIAPERVVPSTMMGLLLGWVSVRTNSILAPALLHVIHNSTLLTLARFREELAGWNIGTVEQSHLPITWLAASATGIIIGIIWVGSTTRSITEISSD